MASPTKNSFMGHSLRRLPRSELDDSVMRDLNRYDARLTANLKTVDRARDVVLKSLESDKKNFMRGGMNSNKKLVKATSKTPLDTRQASALALQQHKYFSDTRTRRAYEQMNTSRRPSTEVIDAYKPVRSKTDLSDMRSESKKKQDTRGEDELNNNNNSNDNSSYRPGSVDYYTSSNDKERSKSNRTSSNSPNDSYHGPRTSITPTIKIDDYDRVSTSPHREDDTKTGVSELVNGRNGTVSPTGAGTNPSPEMSKRQSSFVTDRSSQPPSTMPHPFSDDYYFSRRPTFWEYLSTPKNPNMNRLKREQLEIEFATRPQETTPTPRSARGQRSPSGKNCNPAPKSVTTQRAKSSSGKRASAGLSGSKSPGSNKGKQQGNK